MNAHKSLLVTLGHNSSAIFIDSANCVIGYEQERLSRIKADSQFPRDAIFEIIKNVGLDNMKGCDIFVSHWFNSNSELPNKYITKQDLDLLFSLSENVTFTDEKFSHHDAHAYSAIAFYEYNKNKEPKTNDVFTIVADGFGNDEEVLSIYRCDRDRMNEPTLIKRVYGYEASLGLMYQYATSFCGMKENQDEYKFLGYESYIRTFNYDTKLFLTQIKNCAEDLLSYFYKSTTINTNKIEPSKNPIDTAKLANVKDSWYTCFNAILESHNIIDKTSFKARVFTGAFVQGVLENYFTKVIEFYSMENVILAGGCFYNVKLNNHILSITDGHFSVIPLAGDQGAAIGMEYFYNNRIMPFDTLAIGKRNIYNYEKVFGKKERENIFLRTINDKLSPIEIAKEIARCLADGQIVNIIYGNMEFGPRALCNTSTLMLPTEDNVQANNAMNSRNEVMPCAPVCTRKNAYELFDKDELQRVIGSDRFMICTHNYSIERTKQYKGVMHNHPYRDRIYTGRPQIVRENTFMWYLLNELEKLCFFKCLVNTSFNYHGQPIVFSASDILMNFNMQKSTLYRTGNKTEVKLYVIV